MEKIDGGNTGSSRALNRINKKLKEERGTARFRLPPKQEKYKRGFRERVESLPNPFLKK